MSFNLPDAVKGYLSPEMIGKIASFLNESESNITSAMSGIVPAVISGFITKANRSSRDADDLLDIVRNEYGSDPEIRVGKFFIDSDNYFFKGQALVQVIFDDKLNGLIPAISFYAGVKTISAGALFSFTGPLAAASIGKHCTELGLGAPALSSFLHGQKTNVLSALPAGLSGVALLLGISKLGEGAGDGVKNAAKYRQQTIDQQRQGPGWLLWLFLFLLLGLAAWYFIKKP